MLIRQLFLVKPESVGYALKPLASPSVSLSEIFGPISN